MVNDAEQRACSLNSTWTVCAKPSGLSPYGICDMAGNIWEWCFDPWVEKPDSWTRDGKAVGTAVPDKRVMRGGSWTRNSMDLRASFRDWLEITRPGCGVGFRCTKDALTPDKP